MLLIGVSFLSPSPAQSEDNELCLSCHTTDIPDVPQIKLEEFNKSIHGNNLCVSCHQDTMEIPHPEKLAPVSCKNCHRIESSIYLQSDHGLALSKGLSEAATCTSCHGKTHTLLSSRDPASPVHRNNIPVTCANCHADKEKMAAIKLSEREPFDTYLHSVHGRALKNGKTNAAVCSDCHGTHDLHAASNPDSKIFRKNIPETCGKCHENVQQVYDQSVHGSAAESGIKEAPVCTDCHGEHSIQAFKEASSSVYVGAITKTCARCHESEPINLKFDLPRDRLKTYQDSYHGLATRLGDLKAANCASCHGWHDILPSKDPRSSTHVENLPSTCGKCHAGLKSQLLTGNIHGAEKSDKHFLVMIFTLFYSIIIPLVIGFMVVHNLTDYLRKAISGRLHSLSTKEKEAVRLNGHERIQHLVLMGSFLALALSGFALKYPDAWWAVLFQSMGEPFRKAVHRWTALIFTINGIWHVLYMAATRRGRFILWNNLMPRWVDIIHPFQLIAFNIGLIKEKPKIGYPSYIERIEYWALLWGSVIMLVTGSFLVFNNYTLNQYPLWMTNLATLIHFYEAVLACSAIVVWHLYWVIFDPDVYPMNWSWLKGKIKWKSDKSHR